MRVISVSSGRADVGILTPVWDALAARQGIDLHVFLTGMHEAAGAPAVTTIPEGVEVHRGGRDIGGDAPLTAATAMAEIGTASGVLYDRLDADLLFLVGDRLDMLPSATAALPFNLPILHLHGGEVTSGAVDDRIRHAITKLSHVHCVSSAGAQRRLRAMGEAPGRIHVTGAPGLDMLKGVPETDAEAFASELGFDDTTGLRLVTVHPETNSQAPLGCLDAVLSALDAVPGPTLFTAPNSDPGGNEIRRRIEAFVETHPGYRFVDTLGAVRYANALRHAAVMVGNSSSGVIEAGLFGLPVVNVGDRQKGRERGANVVDVPSDATKVREALERLSRTPARFPAGTPYGDGRAAPRIADVVAGLSDRAALLAKDGPKGWPQ